MIDLACREEEHDPLGIEYLVQDVTQLSLCEAFDVVVAAYLLNYAQSPAQLLEMCRAIARHLKPGRRFVIVNNNPNHKTEDFMSTRKYGFIKQAHGPLIDGTPVDYIIFLDEGSITITNYHLSVATHERAFSSAGFRQVKWHHPDLSTPIAQSSERDHWVDFLNHPPVIFLGVYEMTQDLKPSPNVNAQPCVPCREAAAPPRV
jgi:SAM-dependent methyltransferase